MAGWSVPTRAKGENVNVALAGNEGVETGKGDESKIGDAPFAGSGLSVLHQLRSRHKAALLEFSWRALGITARHPSREQTWEGRASVLQA